MKAGIEIDWAPLQAELQIWHERGLVLPLWWRDDDAIAPSEGLERLAEMSETVGVPVHLAVIPKLAQETLAERMCKLPSLIPVVHGFAHENHAPEGQKKAEFGASRAPEQAMDDFRQGHARLKMLFGERLQPMFVPPWNRIDPQLFDGLLDAGFTALSTFAPRTKPNAVAGLAQVNTHLDPIAWHAGRGLVAPQILISQLCELLQARREGRADNGEPLGILTHHLVHDEQVWEFTRQMLCELMRGPIQTFDIATSLIQEPIS